ncbi:MAG: hypothetical protein KAY37_17470, partial [Phycisphaerae bacterium]|nr:hypothetical protein [Phycisphaerae bacterium]
NVGTWERDNVMRAPRPAETPRPGLYTREDILRIQRGHPPRPAAKPPAAEPSEPETLVAKLTLEAEARKSAAPQPRPESALAERTRAALQNRSDLQSALVLSEILAPPLALRKDGPR